MWRERGKHRNTNEWNKHTHTVDGISSDTHKGKYKQNI